MASALRPNVQRWLEQHCDSSDAVSGGVVILNNNGRGLPDMVAEWPTSGTLTPSLASAAQAAVQRGRPVVFAPTVRLVDSDHNRVISLPLKSKEGVLGAVALAVRADDTHAVEALFKELAKASATVGSTISRDAVGNAATPSARVLALQSALLAQSTLAEGVMALATELAAAVGAQRVTLGVLKPEMHVIAVSNSADFKSEQRLLRLVATAMQEAVDQGVRVSYPALATEPARMILAHADLQAHTDHALLTVPLVHAGKAVGALQAEWRTSTPPDAEQIALCEGVASAIGSLVSLRQTAERSWRSRLAQSAQAPWQQLARRDNPLPKVALAAGLGLLLTATLLPVDYRVGAPARIEGAVQRVVAAPMDGFLQRSHVRPGDAVRAGDLLVELADQDLVLEQRKWESALAQHENGYAAALARADRAQFVISQARPTRRARSSTWCASNSARTRLVAPIDGVVIKGDLSQALGAPVQRGDALLTLAPREQYRLIVEVDERDIADVQRGPDRAPRAGLAARARRWRFVVERVTPVATCATGAMRSRSKPGCSADAPSATRTAGRGEDRCRRPVVRLDLDPPHHRLAAPGAVVLGSHELAGIAVQRTSGTAWRACSRACARRCGAAPALARSALVSAVRRRHRAPAPHQRSGLPVHRPLRRPAHGARGLERLLETQRDAAPDAGRGAAAARPAQRARAAAVRARRRHRALLQAARRRRKAPAAPRRAQSVLVPLAAGRPGRLACTGSTRWRKLLFRPLVFWLWLARAVGAPCSLPAPNGRRCGRMPGRTCSARLAWRMAWLLLPADEGPARTGPRAGGAALGRRSARGRHRPAVPGAGAVCRCLGGHRLPAPPAARDGRRGRHHGRTGAGGDSALWFWLTTQPGWVARRRVRA